MTHLLSTLLFFLFGVTVVGGPSDLAISKQVSYLKSREYICKWEFFPLTCFPPLKARSYPWAIDCFGCYPQIDSVPSGSVCAQHNGICYFGTKTYADRDSVYIYRAESYQYEGLSWEFLEDYIVVTGTSNEILDVLKRNNEYGPFRRVLQ
jgi:hypothetical protein